MLNYNEYLLTCAAEECAEIAQEVSKCIRFGVANHDPRPGFGAHSHGQNLAIEFEQLRSVMEMLYQKEVIRKPSKNDSREIQNDKKAKVKKYYKQYESRVRGSNQRRPRVYDDN